VQNSPRQRLPFEQLSFELFVRLKSVFTKSTQKKTQVSSQKNFCADPERKIKKILGQSSGEIGEVA
jgi:hypothetical protein